MNEKTEMRVNKAISSVVNCSSAEVLPENHLYYDLLVDSLMMTDLILILEQEFNINIKDESLGNVNYVSDLYGLVKGTYS